MATEFTGFVDQETVDTIPPPSVVQDPAHWERLSRAFADLDPADRALLLAIAERMAGRKG